jgi:hypothetical protein
VKSQILELVFSTQVLQRSILQAWVRRIGKERNWRQRKRRRDYRQGDQLGKFGGNPAGRD